MDKVGSARGRMYSDLLLWVTVPNFRRRYSFVHALRPARDGSALRTAERVAVELRRKSAEEARPTGQGKVLPMHNMPKRYVHKRSGWAGPTEMRRAPTW